MDYGLSAEGDGGRWYNSHYCGTHFKGSTKSTGNPQSVPSGRRRRGAAYYICGLVGGGF